MNVFIDAFSQTGTGKTKTLVAAIDEIITISEQNHVLVCCNSNTACDEIVERLIPFFENDQLIRLYTTSYNKRKMDYRFEPYSNWCRNQFTIPSLKELYSFKVIVCTLVVAGNFARAYNDPHFNPTHFSHIIIDESANTHETMTMIPIAGI